MNRFSEMRLYIKPARYDGKVIYVLVFGKMMGTWYHIRKRVSKENKYSILTDLFVKGSLSHWFRHMEMRLPVVKDYECIFNSKYEKELSCNAEALYKILSAQLKFIKEKRK